VAKKMKCPTCGAKNGPTERRCRVCTGILNAEIPEQRKGLAVDKTELGREPDPVDDLPVGEPVGGIEFDAAIAPVAAEAAPPAPAPAAADDHFDPDELFREMGK
jgi:hypothetical protein